MNKSGIIRKKEREGIMNKENQDLELREERETNRDIERKNKRNLRELEQVYVNGTLSNLKEIVEEKKKELEDKLIRYSEENRTTKYTKKGEAYEIPNLNPIIIQNYFFKSINPIGNREPEYNAEKLAIIFELYSDIVSEINSKIGDFIPNISSFCLFAGITTQTFKNYKRSTDLDLRTIYEKINDYCFNSNLTLAQSGKLSEKSTIYRMKVEEDKSEKSEPQIHIHADTLDMEMVNRRLKEIQDFNLIKSNSIPTESKEDGE